MPAPRVLAALLLAALALPAGARAQEFVDGIAAQVGADIVLASEVQRFAEPVEKQMREDGAPESEIVALRAEILERMIERRLLEQAIRRTEIEASDAEVDSAVEAIAKENKIDVEQLKQSVVRQGMTYEQYREQIRGEIQRQKLVSAAVHSRVRVDEAQIKAAYAKRYAEQPSGGEEVHVRHILVPFDPEQGLTPDEACAAVERARARIVAGADFAAEARQISAVNPQLGGDVGWVHASSLAPWMAEALGSMKPPQVSRLIRTDFGCNLLMLQDRRPFKPLSYEDARPMLYQEIFAVRVQEEYSSFLEKLREQTYIERKGMYAEAAPPLTEPSTGEP
jgi:peptidyl-prolyl cis-trans isomerase SurA